jgi:PAS domain S-box-containing protein
MANNNTWNNISLSALLDTIQCLVVTLDINGHVTGINSAGCDVLGYGHTQIIGKGWFSNFVPEPDREKDLTIFGELVNSPAGTVKQFKSNISTKKGELLPISWNATAVKDEKKNIAGVLFSGADLSKQNPGGKATGVEPGAGQIERQINREEFLSKITNKLLESPLEQTRQAVEQSLREVNSYMQVDRCYFRIISDDGGKFNCTCTGPHEDAEPTAKRCQELSFESFSWSIEKLKRGEIIEYGDINQEIPPEGCNELEHWKAMGYVSILIIPILREGSLTGWFGFGTSERGKKWDERDTKMLQVIGNYLALALDHQIAREKEQELQHILLESEKLAKIGSWEWDLKTNKIKGSPEFFRLLGFKKEFPPHLTYDFVMSKIQPEETSRIEQKRQDILATGIIEPFETRLLIDDSVKHIKVDGKLIAGDSGQPVKIAGFLENITGLKKRELELRESEARLSLIYNSANDLMALCKLDENNNLIFESFNALFLKVIGEMGNVGRPDEMIGQEVGAVFRKYILLTETEVKERLSRYYKAIKSKKPVMYIAVTNRPDAGEMRHETTLVPITNKGKTTHILMVLKDITEKAKAEQKIRENEERLKLAIEAGRIGIYDLDVTNNKIQGNERLYQIFEFPNNPNNPKEKELDYWMSVIHPDDKKWVLKTAEDIGNLRKLKLPDYRIQFPGKRVKYVSSTIRHITNDEGKLTRIIGTVIDITERKEAEKKIAEQQNHLQLALEATQIGYFDWDITNHNLYWDDKTHQMFGLDPASGMDRYTYYCSVLHPDDAERILKSKEYLIAPDNPETKFDDRYRVSFGGETKYISSKGILIRDEDGNALRMIGTVLDITGYKVAELKLKVREERYRTLFENANDAILVMENDEFIDCNSLALELYGCDNKAQLIGANPWVFSPPLQPGGMASKEKGMQYIQKALNGQPQRFYWLHCKLNDKSKTLHVEVSLNAFDAGGKTLILATVRDITERVKMVEALQNSEQQYKTLVETSLQSISIFQQNKIVYINPFAVEMTGYSEEEVYAMTFEYFCSIIHPNDLEQALKKFDIKRKDTRKFEYRLRVKSGGYRWFRSLLKHFIYNGHLAILVTSIDITEQKKARGQIIANAVLSEDRERKRIATELHDGLGQMLTAISLSHGSIKNVEALDEKSRTNYYATIKMIKQAMDENRSISHNLMPQAIADYGYVSAVEQLIDNLHNSSSVALEFFTNLPEERLPEHLERNLYRITQEAVNNIVRHAHAATGVVQLMKYPDLLILTIEDDGQGFDARTMSKTGHLGLQSIKTRSEAIGGALEIDSRPGNGTSITLQISLADE